jgi:hypothetical protein
MRAIDSNILAELAKSELRQFYLLKLDNPVVPMYYTDCDVDLYDSVDAVMCYAHGFSINDIQFSLSTIVDSVDITIDDLNAQLKSIFIGSTLKGYTVTLKSIYLNSSYVQVADPIIIFIGEYGPFDINESQLKLSVYSMDSRWANCSLNRQGAPCRYKVLGGPECRYLGIETTCDRTYRRCSELRNTANFGGERWLPSIIDKEIWWGARQYTK